MGASFHTGNKLLVWYVLWNSKYIYKNVSEE